MNVKAAIIAVLPGFLRIYAKRIEESPLGYRLARGAFWSVAGAVISKGLGILSGIVVARTLGTVGFGELGIISSTAMMFQVFAGFSLGVTATKYVAEFRSTDPEKAGRIISLAWVVSTCTGGLCAALLFIFAPWLASHTLAAPHLGGLLKIASAIIFIAALNGAQIGALSGFEAFKTIAIVSLIAGILNFPLMVAGVLLAGLKGAVWAMVVSNAASWLLCHLAIRYEAKRFGVPLRFSGYFREIPILWKFSVPAVLSGLMFTPINWVCNAMLVNQPNGYAEMGLLNAANQWRNAILYLPAILCGVILPILSDLAGSNDVVRYRKFLLANIALHGSIALCIAAVVCIFARLIMSSYGKGFEEGGTVLTLLTFSAVLMAVNNVIGQSIASKGKMWLGFMFNTMWAAVLLTATYWWVSDYGAVGLALALVVAYSAHSVWQYAYISHILRRK